MTINNLIGKAITDVYVLWSQYQEWLDVAECYFLLDNKQIIEMPLAGYETVLVQERNPEAKSVFRLPKDNLASSITGSEIVDILWYVEDSEMFEHSFLLLGNGGVIGVTRMSPSGTGQAGLNYYESVAKLVEHKGKDFCRLIQKR